MELSEFFFKNPKAAIAFSGGADSAYLLYAAKKYGADVKPYYIKTAFGASFEYEDAKALCKFLGILLIKSSSCLYNMLIRISCAIYDLFCS